MTIQPAMAETDIIAPNFKRRLSGVTATVVRMEATRPIRSRVWSSIGTPRSAASAAAAFSSTPTTCPNMSSAEPQVIHSTGLASSTGVGSDLSQFRMGTAPPRN